MAERKRTATLNGMTIWRMTDGRPGHDKQSAGLVQGLVEAIADLGWPEPEVETFLLPKDLPVLREHWRHGTASPDLVLGAGRATQLSLLRTKFALGSQAVLLMRPYWPSPLFDLMLIPEHDVFWSERKVLRTMGMLGPVSAKHTCKVEDKGLILLGGESRHFIWNEEAVLSSIRRILTRDSSISWTLTDSRRTPAELTRRLGSDLDIQVEDRPQIVHWRDADTSWLSEELATAAQVWVTADSASMLYEALSAGAKVGVIELPYRRSRSGNKLQRGLDQLLEQERIALSSRGSISDQRVRSVPLGEHIRCAQVILMRLFIDGASL